MRVNLPDRSAEFHGRRNLVASCRSADFSRFDSYEQGAAVVPAHLRTRCVYRARAARKVCAGLSKEAPCSIIGNDQARALNRYFVFGPHGRGSMKGPVAAQSATDADRGLFARMSQGALPAATDERPKAAERWSTSCPY